MTSSISKFSKEARETGSEQIGVGSVVKAASSRNESAESAARKSPTRSKRMTKQEEKRFDEEAREIADID